MSVDQVAQWLSKKIAGDRAGAMGVAVAGGLGGFLATAVTFGAVYSAIWFVLFSFRSTSNTVALVLTIGMMIALFVGNITTAREYLESYSFTTGTASDKIVSFEVPKVGVVSNINPIAPDSAHSYLKMFVSILFTAPRLVMGALHNFRRWKRLGRFDVDGCAPILAHLLEKEHRVPLTEIGETFPDHDLAALLPQLAELGGVLFLKSGAPGLGLSTDLRREIAGHLQPRADDVQ